MGSPLLNSPDRLDSNSDHFRPSPTLDRERPLEAAETPPDAAAGADDLQRLESSIQWIKREGMLARLEAGHRAPEEIRKLPRAAVLPPVSGIPMARAGTGRRRPPCCLPHPSASVSKSSFRDGGRIASVRAERYAS
jgi:hypothetical protein